MTRTGPAPRQTKRIVAHEWDSREMKDAIATLNAAGILFRRQTEHQLKIGPWNYYPGRGTLSRDSAGQGERNVKVGDLLARIEAAGQ